MGEWVNEGIRVNSRSTLSSINGPEGRSPRSACSSPLAVLLSIRDRLVLLHLLVELTLQCTHSDLDDLLNLDWQIFQATKREGTKDFVKTSDNK